MIQRIGSGYQPWGSSASGIRVVRAAGISLRAAAGGPEARFTSCDAVVCLLSSLPAEAHPRLWHGREAHGFENQVRRQGRRGLPLRAVGSQLLLSELSPGSYDLQFRQDQRAGSSTKVATAGAVLDRGGTQLLVVRNYGG
eukprot:Skav211640  [mRNA]  locus=scaffold3476:64496:68502:+ [translate_table: standard]